ncbi:E3 ubiquitin-protein ligase TRIM7-like [Mugil cephalus]|uniref:E3 ubiquitin-protein ligase TRIM7-like n=1 Tax=Mugil cephalus TaxID=48193 RepID=UPI001FB856A6|nr:E3 ubiquitin-protein ligase TRIM7-like [Mugil cephalus]XP_047430680.1 E3 ubiquitin-protein ligase TRIM7-like [Mugil cephalus]
MATASSLLSEERFLCSICLDVFTQPVSTPCGHNFCTDCIHTYWDSNAICQCPFCKTTFSSRPELRVNTIMSELVAEFEKMVQVKSSAPKPQLPQFHVVPCDICSDVKEKAVKSCLMCLMSFCQVHLEPHHRVPVLKSHKLIDAVSDLDDRMCKKHNKVTELYCRTDQACVCVSCFKTDHRSHDIVPLEEEYELVIVKKDAVKTNIQKMIQSRSDKIDELEKSIDISQKEAEKEKGACVQVFSDLISFIRRSQAEIVEVIDERNRAMKEKAEGFLKELRMEVAELQRRSSQLEHLSQSEDHHSFLQNFPTLSSPLEKDWTNVVVQSNVSFGEVRNAPAEVKLTASEIVQNIPEIKMKRMREHAVDLTLDPDTAYCSLIISENGKQVTTGNNQNLTNNPKRFEMYPEVLAKEGFIRKKIYFEVQVKKKTEWIVGIVRESLDRKGNTGLSVSDGYWTFGLDEGLYFASENSKVAIKMKENLQTVAIFVDYDKGSVSFYNVDSGSHIYSFKGQRFTEKLYPYFCPQDIHN